MAQRLLILLLVCTLAVIALGAAQARTGRVVAQSGTRREAGPEKAVITFARFEDYFGVASAYKITIYADGRVAYVGEKNVRVKGVAWGRISKQDLQRLIGELHRVKFFSLRDRYGAGEGCPFYLYDASSVYIRAELDGKEKAVFHDLGCMENGGMSIFPAELHDLEGLIDITVKSDQWVK